MKPYVVFFNARNPVNTRQAWWNPSNEDPPVDEWIVGELESYYTHNSIDCSVEVLSHHKSLDEALSALKVLVE